MKECNCEGCELKSLFFENVSTADVEFICSQKVEKTYKKGEPIILEGEKIEDFTYLKSGLVKLFKRSSNEKEQIICFALPMDFVSLLSIFSEDAYNYSVTALQDSVTCCMRLDKVKEMANQNGRFASGIMQKINRTTDRIILDFLEVKQRRLNGRIAYILLYFANEIFKSHKFELPVSRKEIGEYIGMTVENVIRTLSDFKKDGIIKVNGPEINIIDMERLRRISELS